ncbi:MAG: hypothetical protein AAB477_02280 [Patescibacteria group bacterium]
MIFQILHIRSAIKEAKEDPGNFAGSQARDVIFGIILIPLIIVLLGLTFLFFLAYTKFLGGPYLFFKIVFIIGLIVSFTFGSIVYKLTSVLRRTTKKVVNKTIENVSNVDVTDKK